MKILKKEFKFEAAHCLGFHEGKCHNVHGHQWKIILHIEQANLLNSPMIIDFYTLKQVVDKYLEKWDHSFIYNGCNDWEFSIGCYLNDIGSKTKRIDVYSTCENLSKLFYDELTEILKDVLTIKIKAVEVYESEGSSCVYEK